MPVQPISSIPGTIGNTPMVEIHTLDKFNTSGHQIRVLGKCEFFNPTASIKDRIVQYIMQDAKSKGELRPSTTILCSSSGNTGTSVAAYAAMHGHKCFIYTSPKCSEEKLASMRAFGAEVEIIEKGYDKLDVQRAAEMEDAFAVNQYENPLNAEAYYKTLGPEIWEQVGGNIDYFVSSGSTGGTFSGTGRFLKEKAPSMKIHLGDPVGSAILPAFYSRPKQAVSFQVEGVGKDRVTGVCDLKVVDSMVEVTDDEAFSMCKDVARGEGLLVGGSAGLNLCAAKRLIEKISCEGEGSSDGGKVVTIVVILPDSGFKYLSKIFNN